MTPGCTILPCRLHDKMNKLKQINIEVFGISFDKLESCYVSLKKDAKFYIITGL